MTISAYNLTGFHTQATAKIENPNIKSVKLYNGLLIAGSYLPIVGMFSGGLKAYGGITRGVLPLSTRVYLVARGILEILGLGLLFLIPDLIVSAHRHLCTENLKAKKA